MAYIHNINEVLVRRADQQSLHVASEEHIRIEFHNMEIGGSLGPFSYQGDVVITCYSGLFNLNADGKNIQIEAFGQAVCPAGERILIECKMTGVL